LNRYWPTYPKAELVLPAEVAAYTEVFTAFYLSKHGGRRLAWQHALGQCVLRGRFAAVGARELQVSLFQAAALLLFNDAPRLSFQEARDVAVACGAVARLNRRCERFRCMHARMLTCTRTRAPAPQIAVATGIEDKELRRTLQARALACAVAWHTRAAVTHAAPIAVAGLRQGARAEQDAARQGGGARRLV
jgi:hypothetical protein